MLSTHFFIPENNLLGFKIKGKAQGILLNKLHSLSSYGWKCILLSNQIQNWIFDINQKPNNLHVIIAERLLSQNTMLANTTRSPYTHTLILKKSCCILEVTKSNICTRTFYQNLAAKETSYCPLMVTK